MEADGFIDVVLMAHFAPTPARDDVLAVFAIIRVPLSLAIQTRGNADDKSARLSNYFTQKAKDLMTDTRGRLVAYMRTCLHVVHTVAARGALQRNFPIFHSSEDDGKDRHSTSTPLSPPARRENR